MNKTCKNCSQTKPITEFYKSRYWTKNKGNPVIKFAVHRNCKECERKITLDRKPKAAAKPRTFSMMSFEDSQTALKNRTLRRKYGISLDEYNRMLESQNGGCAICGEPPTAAGTTQTLAVDHCHETGRVRGLLCHKHNSAIGLLNDSPELLQKSIDYLRGTR